MKARITLLLLAIMATMTSFCSANSVAQVRITGIDMNDEYCVIVARDDSGRTFNFGGTFADFQILMKAYKVTDLAGITDTASNISAKLRAGNKQLTPRERALTEMETGFFFGFLPCVSSDAYFRSLLKAKDQTGMNEFMLELTRRYEARMVKTPDQKTDTLFYCTKVRVVTLDYAHNSKGAKRDNTLSCGSRILRQIRLSSSEPYLSWIKR